MKSYKWREVLSIVNGKNQKYVENPNGTYPIYGSGGIIGYATDFLCPENSIILGRKGSINKPIFVKEKFWNVDTAFGIIPNKNILLPLFLYYFCIFFNFEKLNTTVTIPSLTKSNLLDITINIPDLKIQTKITNILSKIDIIIYQKTVQLSKLDTLVKSRFIEMFGDENYFQNWPTCKIGDIAKVYVGIVIKPSQYYTSDIKSGIKAFRSLNIGEMYIKNNDWVYFTKEGHQKNPKSIIKENDVLIVRSGFPGTACVATKEYAGYNAIDIIIAHPNCKKINPIFLAMFTNMPHGMNQIRKNTGGAAQQHFNVGEYKNITIILPPLTLQEQFAAFVQQVDKSKLAVKQSLEKLETLKKSLMQDYFG